MSKWLDIAASEEMDSKTALPLIQWAIGYVLEDVGIPESVLSVGCSDGTEMFCWLHQGSKVVRGIDMNDVSLSKCQEDGLSVQKMDMHKMTFSDNSFELVFMRDVFEHSLSHIEVLSEATRVSSKYIAIVLPSQDWHSSKWHYIIPTLEQMISLGMKVNVQLKAYREYSSPIGNALIRQYYYLFEKHV